MLFSKKLNQNQLGQVAVEYMIVAAFLIIIIMSAFFFSSSGVGKQVEDSKSISAVSQLASAIDQAYALGPGTKMTVTIIVPDGVQGQIVENELIGYIVDVVGKPAHYYEDTKAKLQGNLPTTPGVHEVELYVNQDGSVTVGNLNVGIELTPSTIIINHTEGSTYSQTHTFTLWNRNLTSIDSVTLNATGSVASFLTLPSITSTMDSNETITFDVDIDITALDTSGAYVGYITVDSNNGSDKTIVQIIIITETTQSTAALFSAIGCESGIIPGSHRFSWCSSNTYSVSNDLLGLNAERDRNYLDPTLDPNIILYYNFNENSGGTVLDQSGNNYHGTLNGDTDTTGNGLYDTYAVLFDGTSDYIEDADGENYINGLSAFTASVWVKSDVTNTDKGIFIAETPVGADDTFGLRYDAGGASGGGTNLLKSGITVSGVTTQYESANNTQSTQWQHLVLTWESGSALSLWINGVKDTPTYQGSAQSGTIDGSDLLFVGRGGKDTSTTSWDGLIDEFIIWDRKLSDTEIAQLYNDTYKGYFDANDIDSGYIDSNWTQVYIQGTINTNESCVDLHYKASATENPTLSNTISCIAFNQWVNLEESIGRYMDFQLYFDNTYNGNSISKPYIVDINFGFFAGDEIIDGPDQGINYISLSCFDGNHVYDWCSTNTVSTIDNNIGINAELDRNYLNGNILPSSLVAYFKFNSESGSIVLDETTNNNDGTLNTDTITNEGIFDTYALTSTTSGNFTVPDSTSLDFVDDFSISLWINSSNNSRISQGLNVIDTYNYNDTAQHSEFKHVTGNIYVVASEDVDLDGQIYTIEIDSSGNITKSVIDSLEFDTSQGEEPVLINVSGEIWAVVYRGPGNDGFVKTFSIDSSGNISNSTIDTLEYNTSAGILPEIIHINGGVYAVAHRGAGSDGWLATFTIDSSGNISNSTIDTFEFDTSQGQYFKMLNVGTNIYAIFYSGPGKDGFVVTLDIDNSGNIGNIIDTFEYDTSQALYSRAAKLAGNNYVIVYEGPGNDGFIITLDIDNSGNIGNIIDTFEYDTTNGGSPHLIYIEGTKYGIAYEGSGDDGFFSTIDIQDNGLIGALNYTIEFDTDNGLFPQVIEINENLFAISYESSNDDGQIVTINLSNEQSGIYKGEAFIIDATTSTIYAGVNGNEISAAATGMNFVTYTYDNDATPAAKLYINGNQEATGSSSGTIIPNNDNLIIGNMLDALIDEFAIYDSALTPQEIEEIYNRSFYGYTDFDEIDTTDTNTRWNRIYIDSTTLNALTSCVDFNFGSSNSLPVDINESIQCIDLDQWVDLNTVGYNIDGQYFDFKLILRNNVGGNNIEDIYVNDINIEYTIGGIVEEPIEVITHNYIEQVRIASGEDDVEEELGNGNMYDHSSDLELTQDVGYVGDYQVIGLRFIDVNIPSGATINNAYIEFEIDSTSANLNPCNLTINGEKIANAPAFTGIAYDLSSRTDTTATVSWNSVAEPAVNEKLQSPDISSIITEIITEPGWAAENEMVIKITGTGTREVESYDGESANAPLLVVDYNYS